MDDQKRSRIESDMDNLPAQDSPTPPERSADTSILLVFLLIGGLLFAAFMFGSMVVDGAQEPVIVPTVSRQTALWTTPVSSSTTSALILTRDALGTTPGTPFTPTRTSAPTLFFKSLTPKPVIYPSITLTRTRVKITRTSAPTRTRTPTPSRTPTITLTLTLTVTPTPSITNTPTITNTATITPTETVTLTIGPTATITPVPVSCVADLPADIVAIPADGDTWIDQDAVDQNFDSENTLSLLTTGNKQRRILIHFNVTGGGSQPSRIFLYLYVISAPASPMQVFVQDVTGAILFDETQATWNTVRLDASATPLPWTNPGGDYYSMPVTSFPLTPSMTAGGGCWIKLEITELAMNWINTPETNLGLILIPGGTDDLAATLASRKQINHSPLLEMSP